MKNRLFITSLFWAAFTLTFIQGCGVDPLDPNVTPGSPNQSPGRNLSVCDDTSLPDCNGDGMNDSCAELLGYDKCAAVDSDNNGVNDLYQLPPSPPTGPEGEAAYSWLEENGFNKTAVASTLASSGLNQLAPNGTKIDIQQQFISIFTAGASPSGLSTNTSLPALCRAVTGHTYLYYKVEGDITYCKPTSEQGTENCVGTPKHSSMELCGELTNASSLPSPPSGTDIVQSNFKWTRGKVSNDADFNGEFEPALLYKRQGTTTTLTLTPTQWQTANNINMFNKVKIKFESAFKIEGWIYSEDKGGWIKVTTPSNVEVSRNFTRSGNVTENGLGMRGLFGAN